MRAVIIIVWLVLGAVYYWMSERCCTAEEAIPVSSTPTDSDEAGLTYADSIKTISPLSFGFASETPITRSYWPVIRDSLTGMTGEDSILGIEGRYFSNEPYEGAGDLGRARAEEVRDLMSSLSEDQVVISSSEMPDSAYSSENSDELIRFRILKNTKHIKEIDDRTIIYFPFNSTRQILSPELETYLGALAERVKETGERISLTGHTDNIGDEGTNREIGEQRAMVIAAYLAGKGVDAQQVTVKSMGENAPIATNETEEGRARNRRVELMLLIEDE